MDGIVLLNSDVVCFHGVRTGQSFVHWFEGLAVIQRLLCTLCSREVAESVVQRQSIAVRAIKADKPLGPCTADRRT